MKSTIDTVIENLIDASLSGDADVRARHVMREALRGLVRLAKSEQMLEIKTNVTRLIGPIPPDHRKAKVPGTAHGRDYERRERQRQLEFNQNNPTQSASE